MLWLLLSGSLWLWLLPSRSLWLWLLLNGSLLWLLLATYWLHLYLVGICCSFRLIITPVGMAADIPFNLLLILDGGIHIATTEAG